MMIRVKYTCHTCGINKCDVEVPARTDDQDVGQWLDVTRMIVSRHHRQQSPACPSNECDLLIPFSDNGQKVGAVQVN